MDTHEAPKRSPWVRDNEANDLLERFLVTAVATILVVRFYLAMTGYPKLGGHGLHIAHLLWGGLFMLVAIVLLVTFLGRPIKHSAAIIGGVGFGLFIDELGKFITSDNNYFFRPTIAIIYAIFILLFLVFREIALSRTVSATWYLANALDLIQDAVIHGWTVHDQHRAVLFLRRSDPADPVVRALTEAVGQLRVIKERASRVAPALAWLRDTYFRLVRASWFRSLLIGIFVLQVLAEIAEIFDEQMGLTLGHHVRAHTAFDEWALGISSVLASSLAAIGLVELRKSRLHAYQWFRRSVLVSILFGRFFAFLNVDVASLFGLAFDLLLLVALQYIIHLEKGAALHHDHGPTDTAGAAPPLAVGGAGPERR
jgi:hypothetical protein